MDRCSVKECDCRGDRTPNRFFVWKSSWDVPHPAVLCCDRVAKILKDELNNGNWREVSQDEYVILVVHNS